jgi:hypothetical protein
LDNAILNLDYSIIISLQSHNNTEVYELDKFLRNAILIVLLIPIVIILSYVGIIPTPATEFVAISFFVFLCFFVIILIVVLGLYYAFKDSMAGNKRLKKYQERDPTICERVVKDGPDGAEYLISGFEKVTFRNACREHWQFVKTRKSSSWIVKDERGNDITDSSLESFDGIAMIVGTYGAEYYTGESESDLPSDYTSIEDSTEYYD